MEEIIEEKKLEGNVAGTSTDKPVEEAAPVTEEKKVDLSTIPVPTEEEVKDANLGSGNESETVSEPEAKPEEVTEAEEKKFTQSQVNDLVGRTRQETRNKTFEYIYGRYGVDSEEGLDNLVGNAQRFDSLKETYDNDLNAWNTERNNRAAEFGELKEKVALMESGINRERYDDAKFILKGKGLEVNAENIAAELETHPEWKKAEKVFVPKEPASKISVLGNEKVPEHGNSEEDEAMRMFKI